MVKTVTSKEEEKKEKREDEKKEKKDKAKHRVTALDFHGSPMHIEDHERVWLCPKKQCLQFQCIVNVHHVFMLDKWQKIWDHLGRTPMDYHGFSWIIIIFTSQSIDLSSCLMCPPLQGGRL